MGRSTDAIIAERHLALAVLVQGGEVTIPVVLVEAVLDDGPPDLQMDKDATTNTVKIRTTGGSKRVRDAAARGSTTQPSQSATPGVATADPDPPKNRVVLPDGSFISSPYVDYIALLEYAIEHGVFEKGDLPTQEQYITAVRSIKTLTVDRHPSNILEVIAEQNRPVQTPYRVLDEGFDPVKARMETDAHGRQAQIKGNPIVDSEKWKQVEAAPPLPKAKKVVAPAVPLVGAVSGPHQPVTLPDIEAFQRMMKPATTSGDRVAYPPPPTERQYSNSSTDLRGREAGKHGEEGSGVSPTPITLTTPTSEPETFFPMKDPTAQKEYRRALEAARKLAGMTGNDEMLQLKENLETAQRRIVSVDMAKEEKSYVWGEDVEKFARYWHDG